MKEQNIDVWGNSLLKKRTKQDSGVMNLDYAGLNIKESNDIND